MKTANQKLNKKDLQNIALGATFLGSGGGGGRSTGLQLAGHFEAGNYYRKNANVRMESIKNVHKKKRGVIVAYMGAPQKMAKICYPAAVVSAVKRLENLTDDKGRKIKKIDYIIPVEIGAISSVVACLAAAKLNIPVLDLDLAGRAVPTLELIMFSTQGVSVNPTLLAAEKYKADGTQDENATDHYCVELRISEGDKSSAASKIESLARPILSMPEYDQIAGLAMWVTDDVSLLQDPPKCIPNTLTLCKELGKVIAAEQKNKQVNISNILNFFNQRNTNDYHASHLYSGTLKEATNTTSGGFDLGIVTVETADKSEIKMLFQNETLLIWDSNRDTPRAMAPDLISYIIEDDEKQLVFSNDDIMENGSLKESLTGKPVHIIALRAPQQLREQNEQIEKLRLQMLQTFANVLEETGEEAKNSLLQNYIITLNHLGYYGKYQPIETIK